MSPEQPASMSDAASANPEGKDLTRPYPATQNNMDYSDQTQDSLQYRIQG